MPTSKLKALRIKPDLLEKVEDAQNGESFSTWMTRAIQAHLEGHQGLGEDFRLTLLETNQQLIELGRLLTEFKAQGRAGHRVVIDNTLLRAVRDEIIRAQALMYELRNRLP